MISAAALALALTASQLHWLQVSYNIGQEYGQSYSVAAVVWEESSFCEHKQNGWSVGCGGTKRRTVRAIFDPSATRQRLVSDNDYSIRASAAILDYCRSHTQNWRREIACYHFGLPAETEMSDAQIDSDPYVLAVSAKVKQLQQIPLDTQ